MAGTTRQNTDRTSAPTDFAATDDDRRALYWWSVRERPGAGRDMLTVAGGWFAAMVILVILVALLG